MRCWAIIILLILILLFIQSKSQENFTTDEAIQNISSLYNQGKMIVTDLNSTGSSTLNNATITNATVTNANIPTLKSTTFTTDNLTTNAIQSKDASFSSVNITGDAKINGTITRKGEVIPIVYPIQWNTSDFLKYIRDNRLFTRDMPNGTLIKFLFINPDNMNVNNTGRNISLVFAVKYGNQFLLFQGMTHTGVSDPLKFPSNDTNWRGDIL